MSPAHPWVVIGNPENRRVAFFQQALARLGQPPAAVFAYRDLLEGRIGIESIPGGAIVRIDSPGEDFAVEKLLLLQGEEPAREEGTTYLTASEIAALPFDRGRILCPRQWYLGLVQVLSAWEASFRRRGDVRLLNAPSEIAVMFDKIACQQLLRSSSVPVPTILGQVAGFDELCEVIESTGVRRLFLKPAHGSSASGVVALAVSGERWEAITSVELARAGSETRLYNSLKIRRYTDRQEIRELIELLLPQRLQLEQWMPKAALDGRIFDLRVVMIRGEPCHIVVRTSRSPLTNLHLGNRRGSFEGLLQAVPPAQWSAAMESCRRAASCFPASLQIAVDLLFTPGFRAHYVLEVNAFGDLLPGVKYHGRDTYEAQVAAVVGEAASRF